MEIDRPIYLFDLESTLPTYIGETYEWPLRDDARQNLHVQRYCTPECFWGGNYVGYMHFPDLAGWLGK